jgi:hypothetical protein
VYRIATFVGVKIPFVSRSPIFRVGPENQVPHRRTMPLSSARRSDATGVERLGDGAVRLGAGGFNLADDRKHLGGEGVSLGALRLGALGARLAEVDRVAQLHALGLAGGQGKARITDIPKGRDGW